MSDSAAYDDDFGDNCAFCGQDLDTRPGIARSMHAAHTNLERLCAATPGSEEFEQALAEVRRFVGVEP